MIIKDTLYVDLETEISKEEFELDLEMKYSSANIEDVYDGEYEVDPSFDTQVLQTRRKLMENDLTVNAIEVSRVSNQYGGKTVYIGGIINA